MDGATDTTAHGSKGDREVRSRKKNIAPGSGRDAQPRSSGSGRVDMRQVRLKRAKARKAAGGRGSLTALCCVASTMFVAYLLVCLVFFRQLDGGADQGGMTGLVKKTREKVQQFRAQHGRGDAPGAGEGRGAEDDAPAPPAPRGPVPPGTWPVSIRDEDGSFEQIDHPGIPDGSVTMLVPRFWADDPVAIHENKLMSRERVMSIGTCITPDPVTGSFTRGDACPLAERSIYVAVASYRDWQCVETLNSVFAAAKHPERIRVAVVDQISVGEDGSCDVPRSPCADDPEQILCRFKDQIDVFQMEAKLAVGPVFARHLGHRMYRGEYYSTQSDAHVTFTKGWDVDIIGQIVATGDEMAVLSTYLTDIVGSINPVTGLSRRHTRPIMCNTEYEGGAQGHYLRHLSQPEGEPDIHGMPQLQPYWAAGYSFSRGHFVATVPYDQYQPMIFQGEEMSIGLRGFTIGYDFFAPEKSVCFHSYNKGENAAGRNKVPHFWENSNRYKNTGQGAMKRLLGIVGMNPDVDPATWNHAEERRYGLGGVRNTTKFYELYGIDVRKKKTQRHLCQFVHNRMHEMFMAHLRPDGMGIDYGQTDFKWVDPRPQDP